MDLSSSSTTLNEVLSALKQVEVHLSQLESEDLSLSEDGEDRAKIALVLAYALNSLSYVSHKAKGLSVEDQSDLLRDFDRVKQYMSKLQKASVAHQEEKSSSRLNKDAAGRFILNATGNASGDSPAAEERESAEKDGTTRSATRGADDMSDDEKQ